MKELFKFQIQVSYFIDEATQAPRHRILNFMKWNIFRNLQKFHHSTSKRHYFGGVLFLVCVSMVVFILSVQNPVIPSKCLRGHRGGGEKKMGGTSWWSRG